MNDEQMTDGTSALAAMPQPLRTIPAATPTPVDLLSMVVARGGSLDEVQKFMDLADRWEAAQALVPEGAAAAQKIEPSRSPYPQMMVPATIM